MRQLDARERIAALPSDLKPSMEAQQGRGRNDGGQQQVALITGDLVDSHNGAELSQIVDRHLCEIILEDEAFDDRNPFESPVDRLSQGKTALEDQPRHGVGGQEI